MNTNFFLLQLKSRIIAVATICLLTPIASFSQASISKNEISDFEKMPEVKWKYHTNKPLLSSPVINGDIVYIGGLDSTLYAIDVNSGNVKWKFSTLGEIRSNVLVNNNQLYLVGGDGTVYSIDKNSGKLSWKLTFNNTALFLGERKYDIADYYNSSPVLYNNIIYFGSGDNRLNAINADNGKLIWTFRTDDIIHATPAIADNKIFIGSFDGNMYALNNSNGNLLWKFKSVGHQFFPKGEMQGSPVVLNDAVFVGARDYNLYAIDINGGYCRWNEKFKKGWALANAAKDSVLYVGTSDDKFIAAIDPANGNEFWRTDLKFNIFGRCSFSKSMLYVGTLAGKVFGLDKKTGAIKWTFTTDGYNVNHDKYFKADDTFSDYFFKNIGSNVEYIEAQLKWGAVFSTPAISNNLIVVTSTDGTVYCLQQST
jgi:outer membrane protein assembly factor BamB